MVNSDNITKLVDELKGLLDGYRSYGQMAVDAIDALDRLRCFVVDGKFSEASKIADDLASQANFYRDFVPDLAAKTNDIQRALRSLA
jgi:hypothetical protein